ncbi:quinone oxidoreductase PIG3 [Tanacetum coccineum]
MKAVVITTPGGPEVLKLQEVEDPVLKDDQVLIKVEATPLNRADTLQRQGLYPPPKGESEYPGLEYSGVVEKRGNNVSWWKVGDQYTCLPERYGTKWSGQLVCSGGEGHTRCGCGNDDHTDIGLDDESLTQLISLNSLIGRVKEFDLYLNERWILHKEEVMRTEVLESVLRSDETYTNQRMLSTGLKEKYSKDH